MNDMEIKTLLHVTRQDYVELAEWRAFGAKHPCCPIHKKDGCTECIWKGEENLLITARALAILVEDLSPSIPAGHRLRGAVNDALKIVRMAGILPARV